MTRNPASVVEQPSGQARHSVALAHHVFQVRSPRALRGAATGTPGTGSGTLSLMGRSREQYRELRRLAYEREESQSAIIREALDCYLESQGSS